MDDRSFDRLARLLGEASDRRTGLKALVGGILGAGGVSALDADAKRKDKSKGRNDGPGAGKKKRKKCNPACDAGFACVKGRCTCASGVTCNGACCGAGQVCRDGACAEPRPACLPFGEPCKDAGRPCCDGLSCASGQDGSFPVTCLRAKGAACAGTDECPFGMTCTNGACLGNGGPAVPLGASCSGGETCAQPGATCSAYTTPGAPSGQFCTLPLRKVCTGNPDCTCYNCWYVNDGAVIGGREGRAAAPVKACIQPKGAGCSAKTDCALGLDCVNGVCTASGTQCAPAGGDCTTFACCSGTCTNGVCSGGGGGGGKQVGDACTVGVDTCPTGSTCTLSADPAKSAEGTKCLLNDGENTTIAANCKGNVVASGNCRTCTVYYTTNSAAMTALSGAVTAANTDPTDTTKNPVYVGPGTYTFSNTMSLSSGPSTVVKIHACDPNVRPKFDGGATTDLTDATTVPTSANWTAAGKNIFGFSDSSAAGYEIDGIDFQNCGNKATSGSAAGAIYCSPKLTLKNSDIFRCNSAVGGIIAYGGADLTNVSVRQCYGGDTSTNAAGGMYIEKPGTMKDLVVEYNGSASNAGGARLKITFMPTASVTLDNVSIRYNSPTGLVNADANGTPKKVICSGTTKSCGNPANTSATGATNCGGDGTYDSTCSSTVCVGGPKTSGSAGSGTCS